MQFKEYFPFLSVETKWCFRFTVTEDSSWAQVRSAHLRCNIDAHKSLGIFQYLSHLMRDDLNAREQKAELCRLENCVVALRVFGGRNQGCSCSMLCNTLL